MQKKAISTMAVIIPIIIALIVVIFVIPWLTDVRIFAEERAIDLACGRSLDFAVGLKLFEGVTVDLSGNEVVIECATDYLTVDSEGEELTLEFTEMIFDCWNTYSKATELFDQETGAYCIICKSANVIGADSFTEALADYISTQEPVKGKGTYLSKFGSGNLMPPGAANTYNFFRFPPDGDTAIIITFGASRAGSGFSGQHLILDNPKGIGLLLHPYDGVSNLGCYSFEGRTSSLEYRR